MVLYDYSRGFSSGSYRGLYGFISFINNLIDKKTSFDDAREGESTDAVKIVTCHASKGLEYPIVFLVDASSRITNKEKSSRLVYSEGFGISMRLRTPSGLALVENPVVDIINHHIERKQYEEELRVLYVALTRARERLYVYGVCPLGKREDYENKIDVLREDLSPYSVRNLASMMEIILVTGDTPAATDGECSAPASPVEDIREEEAVAEEKRDSCDRAELTRELVRRFTYEYPHRYLTELPEKIKEKGSAAVCEACGIGAPTLHDIVAELLKPGRDVRDSLPPPALRDDVMSMEDLKPEMVLNGIVCT